MIRVCPLTALPRGEALRVEAEPPMAVYRRGDEPVAVLGMNQARPFTRWRRQLNAAPVPA